MHSRFRSKPLLLLALLGVLIAPLLGAPAARAASVPLATAADCPPVLFLGAHGVNEGSTTDWGPTVQAVWTAFQQDVPAAGRLYGDYPLIRVDWSSTGSVTAERVAKLVVQVGTLELRADEAAAALEAQVSTTFERCGTRTRIVLAGMSLGGWAIDKALRGLRGREAARAIAAAGVMGDPAYPTRTDVCTTRGGHRECMHGIATGIGRGYPDVPSYLDNGITNFASVCLAVSETRRDPICGQFAMPDLWGPGNLALHDTGYRDSGLAASLGHALAGAVTSPGR
jgi:hypothetical protein